jgi:hypothetical protein
LAEDDDGKEGEEAHRTSIAVLPPVTWIRRGNHRTRLRYAVEVLTINNDKFIRLDAHDLLHATNVPFLTSGPNVTIHQAPYRHWTGNRDSGRPQILFQLYPLDEYEYTASNNRRKKAPHEFRPAMDQHGRILLNAHDRPLKSSNVMPLKCSTEIEGWEIEAVCRLDPDLCHQDFVDRMLPSADTSISAGTGKTRRLVRPSKGTLNHRRRRDRMKMRVLPWPLPRQLSYSDTQVVNQLSEEGRANNSTRELRDLTKDEIEMQYAVMYGGHFERSGRNAQNDGVRLQTLRANLALVRTRYAEESEEVSVVRGRVAKLVQEMGDG